MCTNFLVDPNPKANLRQRRHIVLGVCACVCVCVGVLYSFVHFINIVRLSFLRVGLSPSLRLSQVEMAGHTF